MRRLGEAVAATMPELPRNIRFTDGQARDTLLQAHAAAVASGTATLEACLMRCPTVLVYAASRITCLLARLFVKGVRHLGLANIVAGREVMPELLQDAFTPERLADALLRYLTDDAARAQVLAGYDEANAKLGTGQASERAAEEIARFFWA